MGAAPTSRTATETPDLDLLPRRRFFLVSGLLAVFAVVLFLVGLLFSPWQQSVPAKGQVIILDPSLRPQAIESPIKARLLRWDVREGDLVKRGDLLVELTEIDTKYLDQGILERKKMQAVALDRQREAAAGKLESLGNQIESLKEYQVQITRSAEAKLSQIGQKLEGVRQAYQAELQARKTAQLQAERVEKLRDRGLKSQRDVEKTNLVVTKAAANMAKIQAEMDVLETEVSRVQIDRDKSLAETNAKVRSIEAYQAEAAEKIAKLEVEKLKLRTDIENLQGRIAQRMIRAPVDGRVVEVLRLGQGETVSPGTQLMRLAPQTEDRALEFVLQGHDAPLVTPGRDVRIQFQGWPALQFSGWPSIAVGTFAGKVRVVDAISNEAGKLRILVVPDQERIDAGLDQPWPDSQLLRPKTLAEGWVQLQVVPLWYELWRVFNGFRPTVPKPKDGDAKVKIKPAGKKGK